MKNNFGYADKQEVVVTPNSPMGEAQNDKQLEEKYQESVIDVEAEDVDWIMLYNKNKPLLFSTQYIKREITLLEHISAENLYFIR